MKPVLYDDAARTLNAKEIFGLTFGFCSQIQLAPIATQGTFSQGNSASGTVQVNIGGPDKNA